MIYEPTREQVQAFLERETAAHLAILGSLLYEPVEALYGFERNGELAAVSLIIANEANIPESLPTIMFGGSNTDAIDALVNNVYYPKHATWVASTPAVLTLLETRLQHVHAANQGMVYFLANQAIAREHSRARELSGADASLDLSPCSLSAIALNYWILRGWRVFGVAEQGQLLGHAVAAYPIGNTEEVSAVFTAPQARRRGVASACAAAAIANIQARGKHAVYVSRKDNTASIRVAQGLGMRRLFETWEITT